MGRFQRFIVPPESVVVKTGKIRRKIITSLVLPKTKNFTPLIVVGNNKSGNSDGANILAAFRRNLNPSQVIDLGEGKMEEALEWCQLASPVRCIVLVCGGDGTIGWLFNTAEKLNLKTEPVVAIFPLGTGDLKKSFSIVSAF